jgi:carboxyl-terminal processing protease
LIDENAKWINERSEDNVYNLQIDKFKAEQKLLEETSKKYKSVLDYKNQLTFTSLPYENEMMKTDTALKEKRQRWHESLAKDIYVDEALNVLGDLQSKELAKKTNVTLKKKDKLVKS